MASTKKVPVPRTPAGTGSKKPALKKIASAPAPVQASGAPKTARKTPTAPKTSAKPVAAPKAEKAAKAKKPKLVRDSFTIPKAEYLVLDELKQRATRLAHPIKKSELLRAGIKALAAMGDTALLSALDQVPAIKTGRPAA